MILSSPFSRHNRSHQSWSNGQLAHHHHHQNHRQHSFHRKPAPQQLAPPKQPQANGSGGNHNFRSHTLNRWDLRGRQGQQQQQQQQQVTPRASLRRNLSSLGHYPKAAGEPFAPSPGYQAKTANGFACRPASSDIYAPASIASPSELAHYKRPLMAPAVNGNTIESQHYAATSCRAAPTGSYRAASESGRSGRESTLGNLLDRLGGTLRRRTRWSRGPRRPASVAGGHTTNGLTSSPPSNPPPPPPGQVALDPEIYATGKRKVEAEAIYAEGSRAIDGNAQRRLLQHQLDESIMSEGETRLLIEDQSQAQADYCELVAHLTNWINDELAQQRIIVADLQEDLYDGQILGKLIEKLHRVKLDLVEVTQNETAQKYKLRMVLDTINRILSIQARWAPIRWSVEGIHGKNMVEIIHLLVTLAIHYRAPVRLPADVRVQVLVVQKHQGKLLKRSHECQLTSPDGAKGGAPGGGGEKRDAFDNLLEFAPEKLAIVKLSLVKFVNRHLNKINMSCFAKETGEVLDPDQFSDGLLLVFLMASLEDYFVPLGNLFTTMPLNQSQSRTPLPFEASQSETSNDISTDQQLKTAIEPTSYINTQPIQKLHNVNVALQLMDEAGLSDIRQRVRAEDIVNGDLKSVLRVLYALFSRYKHL